MGTPYSFGSYNYEADDDASSGSIIESAPRVGAVRQRVADAPGSSILYTKGGLPGARQFTLGGTLFTKGSDDPADIWDAFAAAHAPGPPQALYLESADWFLLAEVVGLRDVNGSEYIDTNIPFEVDFLAQNPFWLADTPTAADAVVAMDGLSATIALPVGGTAPARCILTITLAAIGAIPGGATYPLPSSFIAVANTANSVNGPVIWARSLAADIICDCAAEQITQNALDAGAAMLGGTWMDLIPNMTNNLTLTCEGGAQITAASVTCVGRKW